MLKRDCDDDDDEDDGNGMAGGGGGSDGSGGLRARPDTIVFCLPLSPEDRDESWRKVAYLADYDRQAYPGRD